MLSQPFNVRAVRIQLSTRLEEAATLLKQWDFSSPSMWADYRDPSKKFPVRVRGDIPLPAIVRKSALSCLWGPTKVKLMNKGFWDGSLRSGYSGYGSGRFQVSNDTDSWALFALKTDDGQFVTAPNREELYQWKCTVPLGWGAADARGKPVRGAVPAESWSCIGDDARDSAVRVEPAVPPPFVDILPP
eukprot:3310917-Pyramimonas_sp.AAC.1